MLSGREQRTPPGGCIVSPAPLSGPLHGPPLLPPAYGSRLGSPRFPLEVTVPTRVRLSPSSFWRLRLSFECQSGRRGNVRRDSTVVKGSALQVYQAPGSRLPPFVPKFSAPVLIPIDSVHSRRKSLYFLHEKMKIFFAGLTLFTAYLGVRRRLLRLLTLVASM